MAATAGQKAIVQINNSTYQTVTGVKTADLQISTGKYDITDLNSNNWILQLAGLSSYTLKLGGNFDMSDAQQALLLADIVTNPGTTVAWKIYSAGTGGGHFFAGSGIVTGFNPKFDVKSEEQMSFDIDGNGAITWT